MDKDTGVCAELYSYLYEETKRGRKRGIDLIFFFVGFLFMYFCCQLQA